MRKRKTYSKEFKEEAIRLVKENGPTCIQVERDLGIGHGAVSKWIRDKKKFQDDAFCGSGNVRPSEPQFSGNPQVFLFYIIRFLSNYRVY